MRTRVLAALSAAAVACTTLIPGTTPHEILRDARALERDRCDREPVDPRLYAPAIVTSVEPYYEYSMGGPNGREAHMAGAVLHLRPLAGLTAELLDRGLLCHAAQLVLGHAPVGDDDPYVLPGGWVKIDVRSGGASFVVRVTADDPGRARELYDRARRFSGGLAR